MNSNDNHYPMSPLGRMIFDMATTLTQKEMEMRARERERLAALAKPNVLLTIRRPR